MKNTLFALLGLAAFSVGGWAQSFEAGGFGGVVRMANNGAIGTLDSTVPPDPAAAARLQDKWMFGLRMTINSWEHFGHEISYAYHRTAFQTGPDSSVATGTAIHTVTYGILAYATPEGSRVRPYAQGGGGFSNFIFPGSSLSQGGGNRKFGVFYGAGIKFHLQEDRPWWIRADFRQHLTGMPYGLAGQSGNLRRNEISIGLSYGL